MSWLYSKYTLWIAGALFVISQTVIIQVLRSVDSVSNILRHQTTFSPLVFQEYLNGWGKAGVSRFLSHYSIDVFHPFIYAVFLSALLVQSVKDVQYRYFWLLPFIAGAFDEIENLSHISVILGWADPFSSAFYIGAVSSWFKWLFVAISLLTIFWELTLRLMTGNLDKKKPG